MAALRQFVTEHASMTSEVVQHSDFYPRKLLWGSGCTRNELFKFFIMSWHTITLFGKVALFLFGLGLGFGIGVYVADPTVIHEGNSVDIKADKVKKGSQLEIKPEQFQKGMDSVEVNEKRFLWWKRR